MAFGGGWIWPDGPQPAPAAIALTGAYVASAYTPDLEHEECLLCRAELGGLAPVEDPGLLVRVDISFDTGATWIPYDFISIPGYHAGMHHFEIQAPERCRLRLSCRDVVQDPDTTCRIYAMPRLRPMLRDHLQLLSLAEISTAGQICWSDGAGVADALGLAFALGPIAPANPWWVPTGDATEGELWITTTAGPPTSVEFALEESTDEGLTFARSPAVNSVVAGIENSMPLQIQFQSAAGTLANGTYKSPRFPVNPGTWIRFLGKRTGAAVDCIATVKLFAPGV